MAEISQVGEEARNTLGIGSDPKSNLKALPGAYFGQKDTQRSKIAETIAAREKEIKPLQESLDTREVARDKFASEHIPVHEGNQPVPKFKPAELQEGFSFMLGLAAFAGMGARQPLTAALNNMSGMMKGVQEGNQANFEHSYKEWEGNFKQAEAKYKDELSAYQKILGDMNKSIDQKMREIRTVAQRYDNRLVMSSINSENPNDLLKLTTAIERQSEGMTRLAQSWSKIAEKNKPEAELPAGFTPSTIDYYARQTLAGDQSWRTGLSRSKIGASVIAAVDRRIPELAGENNISPEEASTVKDIRHSISHALTQRQQFVSSGNQFVSNFKKQADLVEKYLKPGTAGEIPALNKWIQAGRKSLQGDTDVTNLDVAIRGLAREHQRIVTGVTSNAQLHASAQATADELLNRAMTADQIRNTLVVMREEAENALSSGKDEVATLQESLKHIGVAGKSGSTTSTVAPPAGFKEL